MITVTIDFKFFKTEYYAFPIPSMDRPYLLGRVARHGGHPVSIGYFGLPRTGQSWMVWDRSGQTWSPDPDGLG